MRIASRQEYLQVDPGVIESQGGVSREVVEQMADGVKKRFWEPILPLPRPELQDQMGERGETRWNYLDMCSIWKEKSYAKKFCLEAPRERIIDQATYTAMQLLRQAHTWNAHYKAQLVL